MSPEPQNSNEKTSLDWPERLLGAVIDWAEGGWPKTEGSWITGSIGFVVRRGFLLLIAVPFVYIPMLVFGYLLSLVWSGGGSGGSSGSSGPAAEESPEPEPAREEKKGPTPWPMVGLKIFGLIVGLPVYLAYLVVSILVFWWWFDLIVWGAFAVIAFFHWLALKIRHG